MRPSAFLPSTLEMAFHPELREPFYGTIEPRCEKSGLEVPAPAPAATVIRRAEKRPEILSQAPPAQSGSFLKPPGPSMPGGFPTFHVLCDSRGRAAGRGPIRELVRTSSVEVFFFFSNSFAENRPNTFADVVWTTPSQAVNYNFFCHWEDYSPSEERVPLPFSLITNHGPPPRQSHNPPRSITGFIFVFSDL